MLKFSASVEVLWWEDTIMESTYKVGQLRDSILLAKLLTKLSRPADRSGVAA